MNWLLFLAADFLSPPSNFYAMLAAMAACTPRETRNDVAG